MAGVLTAGDPSAILQQGSLLMELSGNRNAQTKQLLADASQLTSTEQDLQRTEDGIAQLQTPAHRPQELPGRAHRHREDHPGQPDRARAADGPGPLGRRQRQQRARRLQRSDRYRRRARLSRSSTLSSAARTSTAAPGRAVRASTAPAWPRPRGPSAGRGHPRTSYEQWASLPHVSTSSMEPGDLLIYNGEGHVAMYVGNGYIIDAPHTGLDVERIPRARPGTPTTSTVSCARSPKLESRPIARLI